MQVPGALQQPLVAALAAVCNAELHSAAGAPSAAPQLPGSRHFSDSTRARRAAVAPGAASAAAHSELLRLCVAALGRAANPGACSTASNGASSKAGGSAGNGRRGGAAGGSNANRKDADAAKAAAQDALSALVAVLEACVGGGARPLADPVASGFYGALTKALRLLVPEV